jgi:hypothetical protein
LTRIDVAVEPIAGDATNSPRLDSVVVLTDHGGRRGWKLAVDLEKDKP